jgi:hypothetical protein
VASNRPDNLNILPFNREEYKVLNIAVYDRKSRYVLSESLLNEYRGAKAEGTNRRSKYTIPREKQRERGACVWTEMNVFTKNMINYRAKAPEVLHPVYSSSLLITILENKKILKSREK